MKKFKNISFIPTSIYICIGMIMCSFSTEVLGQDIHFSQYYSSPQNLNPSLYGNYFGTQRVILNYRRQWTTVPVSFNTISFAYDTKVLAREIENGVLGWGIHFNNDKAGDGELSLLEIGTGLAYSLKIDDYNFIGVGGSASYNQRRFNEQSLTFDNQFNGEIFDGRLGSGETFQDDNFSFVSYNVGANWHFQVNNRNFFTVAGAAFHLNEPSQTFFEDEDVVLSSRYSLTAYGNFYVKENIDILPSVLYDIQGVFRELNYGVLGRFYIDDPSDKRAVLFGIYNRWNDAIILQGGYEVAGFKGVASFDINVSDFQQATRNYGAFELGLSYIFNSDENSSYYVECPYF